MKKFPKFKLAPPNLRLQRASSVGFCGLEKIKNETKEKYGDRINLFHSDIKGLLRARHTLIRKATGEYCLCVDSDDFVDDDYLLVIYEALKTHNFPDILIHNFIKCDENGKDDPNLYTPFVCEDKYLMDYFLYSN